MGGIWSQPNPQANIKVPSRSQPNPQANIKVPSRSQPNPQANIEVPNWPVWNGEEKKKLVDMLSRSKTRSSNVLLVGKPGAGKSSFCTSMECALTETPSQEVGSAGRFDIGGSVTFRLRRFKLFENPGGLAVFGRSISSLRGKMPVFYDMPGMQDFGDKRFAAILQCIILGRIQPNENILMIPEMTPSDIMDQFPENSDSGCHKIDRVVFVHSAAEYVPVNLVETVVSICREHDVTLFSILSHYDRKEKQCSYDDLALALGTKGSPRGCEVQLYHGGMEKHGRYTLDYRTNYFMCLLWQRLLNPNYPIHSSINSSPESE